MSLTTSIMELMEYWIKDWETETPALENMSHFREWEVCFKKATNKATVKEMIDVWHISDGIDLELLWDMHEKIGKRIVGDLYDKVDTIETSLKLLLKEFGDQPAKITVNQLNRLKSGV